MDTLFLCITVVVVVTDDEHTTFELKQLVDFYCSMHLSCYPPGKMTQCNPGLQPDSKQNSQSIDTQLCPYC